MPKESSMVYLHAHRELEDHPEKELQQLLWQLLEKKYQGDLLALTEAYSEEKAEQALAQILAKGRIDRDELYDALIAWARSELGSLSPAAKVLAMASTT